MPDFRTIKYVLTSASTATYPLLPGLFACPLYESEGIYIVLMTVMIDSDILIQSEVGSYDRDKYNGIHVNNIGAERRIGVYGGGGLINVESGIPQK